MWFIVALLQRINIQRSTFNRIFQPPMRTITIHLLKPGKGTTVTYEAEVLEEAPGYALVRAIWERAPLALGYVTFETGDRFYEHFFADRWYNIFELRSAGEALKGWYCNVTRPAEIGDTAIVSEDLEIDLFVSPDRRELLRLDVDEFEARGLAASEPDAYAAAYAAIEELERMARAGHPPFSTPHGCSPVAIGRSGSLDQSLQEPG
jgi:hypothetical protein